ncbi:Lrp/AsnC family transcriptional regulator [Rhodococcus sp. WS3]|uniref:Lrp/AsnC family transcriptional regulator n=1 Tax=Rhodococcus sp. WS3 TaxID=2486271 RepID=UPI001143B759|nr:Lrp/AsnC family transcriptional regulator [Rhodococcus sp. WS3]ROZ50325.1 Lrp/AsnC family transcriptional regulator [Rhodococcus sp. WS3]
MAETDGSSTVFDALDRAIVQVLARDLRASFADVGARLGCHERTVARRLERMTETGAVRFTAGLVPEYLGEGLSVDLAVRCAPGRLDDVAVALAALPETHAVEVTTGSLQIHAEATVADNDALLALIDGSIGRIGGVLDVHCAAILQLLLTAADWAPFDSEPTSIRRSVAEGTSLPGPIEVDDLDRVLAGLLRHDPRMPMSRLAKELNIGESTARRRLARLKGLRVLHLRLFVDPAQFGFTVEARLELEVEHRHLDAAVRRLAAEPSVRHLVTTTGRSNVLGYSRHTDAQDLYAFTGRVFGALDGVRQVQTALVVRAYKSAGVLM